MSETVAQWRPPATGRPATVLVAALLTWFFSSLVLFAFLVTVAMLLFAQDALVEALQSDPRLADYDLAMRDLLAALWVTSAVAIVWSSAAIALAVLTFRRVNGARIGLAASSVMTVLASVFLGLPGIVLVLAAGATIWLLFAKPSARWFAGPRSGPPYGDSAGSPRPPASAQPPAHPAQSPPHPQQPPQQQPQQPPSRPSGKPPVW